MPDLNQQELEALRELTYNVLDSLATDGESSPPTDAYNFWRNLHTKLNKPQ